MKKFPVYTSVSAVCDSSGYGVTSGIGPNVYGTSWEINLVRVTNTSQTNQSVAFVYLNAIGPSWQIGGSWSGNMDSDSDPITLQFGDKLIGVWTGADAGSISQLLISGTGTDVR